MNILARRFVLSLAAVFVSGCGWVTPGPADLPDPPMPPTRTYVLEVTGERGLRLSRAVGTITTDAGDVIGGENLDGVIVFVLRGQTGGADLQVDADGYKTFRTRIVLHPVDYTLPGGVTLERTVQPLPRLSVVGRELLTADGGAHVWRAAMAFQLLDHLSDGRQDQAVAFLDWAAATGFTAVRTLTTLAGWMDLPPEEGQRHLPTLMALAAARRLYVQPVALAGTKVQGMTREAMRAHVAAVGAICAAAPNCGFLEIANEPSHPSQQDDLREAAFLAELRALVPAGVPVAYGANCCGEPDEPPAYPEAYRGGDLILVHADRSRDTWHRTRHAREFAALSEHTGKYAISNEPTGAGEVDRGGSRSANVHEFYGQGVLSRIFGYGATLHCEDCLYARVPGPVQQEAARAFIAGTKVVPDDVRLHFFNSGWHGSPVRSFAFTEHFGDRDRALRAYSGVSGDRGIVALVGVTGDPAVEWANGWTPMALLEDRPGIRVLEIRR